LSVQLEFCVCLFEEVIGVIYEMSGFDTSKNHTPAGVTSVTGATGAPSHWLLKMIAA
jgi:hypothetical protein